MTTVANVLRDRVRTALQGVALASAAGIPSDDWAAGPDDGGHVFDLELGFIRGRSRGRLPFLEFLISTQNAEQLAVSGGVIDSQIKVVVNVGGRGDLEAVELASDLADLAVTAIRAIADNYCKLGKETYGSFKPGPYGHTLDVTLGVQHSYGRAS